MMDTFEEFKKESQDQADQNKNKFDSHSDDIQKLKDNMTSM